MIEMTIKVNLKKEFNKFLKRTDDRLTSKVKDSLKRSMNYVRNRIASNAPFGETGELKRQILELPISSIKNKNNSGFTILGDGNLKISLLLLRRKDRKIIWLNNGTGKFGPYKMYIYPTEKEFLQFKVDGRWIKISRTKGIKGKRFIEAGVRESRSFVIKQLERSLGV